MFFSSRPNSAWGITQNYCLYHHQQKEAGNSGSNSDSSDHSISRPESEPAAAVKQAVKLKIPDRFLSKQPTEAIAIHTVPSSVDIDEAFFQPLRQSWIKQYRTTMQPPETSSQITPSTRRSLNSGQTDNQSERSNKSYDNISNKSDPRSDTRSDTRSETQTDSDREVNQEPRRSSEIERTRKAHIQNTIHRIPRGTAERFGRNTHTLSRRIKDGIDEYLQGKFVDGSIVGRGVFRSHMLTDIRTGLAFSTDFAPSAIAYMQMYMSDWENARTAVAGLSIPVLPFNTPFTLHQLRVTSCCRDGEYVMLIESEYPSIAASEPKQQFYSLKTAPTSKLNFRVCIKVVHDGKFIPEQVHSTKVKGYELKSCEATLTDVLLSVFTIQTLAFQLFPSYS